MRDWLLYALIVALVLGCWLLPDPLLQWACLCGLAAIWLATPTTIHASAAEEAERTRKHTKG